MGPSLAKLGQSWGKVGAKLGKVEANLRQSQTKLDKMVELAGQEGQDGSKLGGNWDSLEKAQL